MPKFSKDRFTRRAAIGAGVSLIAGSCAGAGSSARVIDYHQHLYSPEAGARSTPGPKGISASDLIREMDAAGTGRAVVLSVAYSFANPNKPPVRNEYEHVKAENDWTSGQIAAYPERLIGFCGINPLRPYATGEIARCAKDPHLKTGLKLHFGNSDVDVHDPVQLAQLRRVFRAANENGMAIVVHARPNVDHRRPYGAAEARILLEQVLPEAPDATVQIAHLAGAGGYDDATDRALAVYTDAIAKGDRRVKNVYFDVCGIAIPGMWERWSGVIVRRMREIGMERLLYGSDAATPDNLPKDALKRWRQLPLTPSEIAAVEGNVAPYVKAWVGTSGK